MIGDSQTMRLRMWFWRVVVSLSRAEMQHVCSDIQRLAQTQLIDYSFGEEVKVYLYHNYVVMMCLKPRNVNIKKTFSSLFKLVLSVFRKVGL